MGLTIAHRDQISALAARHRLPAVYSFRYFVTGGGLMSYGPDDVDSYRRAAGYIDRILKGEKPADLPVQAPTKYDLVINLKTAKTLGLEVPATLLARAPDQVDRSGHGLASNTRLNGVSAALRNRVKPPEVTTSRIRASPACAPSASPTSCDSDAGVQRSVEKP